jgi:hypothetical protein
MWRKFALKIDKVCLSVCLSVQNNQILVLENWLIRRAKDSFNSLLEVIDHGEVKSEVSF